MSRPGFETETERKPGDERNEEQLDSKAVPMAATKVHRDGFLSRSRIERVIEGVCVGVVDPFRGMKFSPL